MTLTNNFRPKGFVVLFAILMVSVVLTLSLSLLNITFKQIILSTTSKDSQIAHYNALSGLYCARFWDSFQTDPNDPDPIPSATDLPFGKFGPSFLPGMRDEISCVTASDGSNINVELNSVSNDPIYTTSFEISFANGGCAVVEVTKNQDDYSDFLAATTISSKGYNLGCSVQSTRKVEREILAGY